MSWFVKGDNIIDFALIDRKDRNKILSFNIVILVHVMNSQGWENNNPQMVKESRKGYSVLLGYLAERYG